MSDLTEKSRTFLETTRFLDEPSDVDRQRIRSATLAKIVAVAAATTVVTATNSAAATTAIAKASGLSMGGFATGWLGGVLTGGLLALGVLGAGTIVYIATERAPVATPSASPQDARPAPTASQPMTTASTEATDSSGAATPPLETNTPRETMPPPSSRSLPSGPPSASTPAASDGRSIDAEIAVLRAAEQALQAGRPDDATRVLDAYDATHTHTGGVLAEERWAARIIADCKAKPGARAHAEMERFLRARQSSPLAARVREACPKESTP